MFDITKFCFIITDFCNMGCKYCCVGNPNLDPNYLIGPMQTMNDDVLYQSIKFAKEHSKPGSGIEFFGGEPLIGFNQMIKVMDAEPNYFQYSVSTNGTLFNENNIQKLYEYKENLHVILSADGYQPIQDKYRPLCGDKSSYEKLLKSNVWDLKYFPHYSIYLIYYPQDGDSFLKQIDFWLSKGFNKFELAFCLENTFEEQDLIDFDFVAKEIAKRTDIKIHNWDVFVPGKESVFRENEGEVNVFTNGDIFHIDWSSMSMKHKLGNVYTGWSSAFPTRKEQPYCKDCFCRAYCPNRDSMAYSPQNTPSPLCRTIHSIYNAAILRKELTNGTI